MPVGETHTGECDVARCIVTGLQRLMCELNHDYGSATWTGLWAGKAECQEFGWMVGPGMPDLNCLRAEAIWNRHAHRWIMPAP